MKNIFKLILIPALIILSVALASAQPHTSANYTLTGGRIVPSGGEAASGAHSLDSVAVGNFVGGKAISDGYVLRAGLIIEGENKSLILNPVTWELGPVEPGSVRTAQILVENSGNVRTDYCVRVYDSAGTWQAGANPGDNLEENTFIISAVFTDTATTTPAFNEDGNEDIATGESARCTDTKFATSLSAENGTEVTPGEYRALWLKFDAPRVDTTGNGQHEEHNIYVEVLAEISN